jgi:hypothetical protein
LVLVAFVVVELVTFRPAIVARADVKLLNTPLFPVSVCTYRFVEDAFWIIALSATKLFVYAFVVVELAKIAEFTSKFVVEAVSALKLEMYPVVAERFVMRAFTRSEFVAVRLFA